MFWFRNLLCIVIACQLPSMASADIFVGQGTMSGEISATTALLQTRLTAATTLNADGDLPGAVGVVCFDWSTKADFRESKRTPFRHAIAERDFIVRSKINLLQPGTQYYYRAIYGVSKNTTKTGPTCSFKTHAGRHSSASVQFIVGSCMNYNKFMHGKAGNAGGPLTATEQDKRQGFRSFVAMKKQRPEFFVGTGDIVYYDNKFRRSETVAELRLCWHEQFRFPRMINFFQDVPTYWSKDDHDFRFNDSDNSSPRLPLSKTGIDLFKEQLPIVAQSDLKSPTYRTYRVSKQLQIWLSEGRDYRSPNEMKDGPKKTMWGIEQRAWLQRTLKDSDAKWKILISPTPMVGPDMAKKSDNHASLSGFRHEADEFFAWLTKNQIENFTTVCGDRHWQYHSIHRSGVEEFACGALNDENSRIGVVPGDPKGTDPNGLVKQPFTSQTPSGGYLVITAGDTLTFDLHDDHGKRLYGVTRK